MPGLDRFVAAQAGSYATALAEIRAGAKRSHWMWFVLPQLRGLGRSETAQFYGIADLAEAQAYLTHPLLGARYVECVDALAALPVPDAVRVFGTVDAMKLRSSLTLFAEAGENPIIGRQLARWCGGQDEATVALLRG